MFVLLFSRTDVLLTRISMFKMSLTSKCFSSLRNVDSDSYLMLLVIVIRI